MKPILGAALAMIAFSTSAFAEGDAAKGEKLFNKCKSCHKVETPEGDVLFKGGRTGPNLYGVVGRTAGSTDFRYSKDMVAAGEAGLIWDETTLAAFVVDPRGFMKEQGTSGKTKMTFKLKKGGADVAAFLSTLGPVVTEVETDADVESTDAAGDAAETSTN